MNNNFYHYKYLKYKNKYLKYKELFGGALGTQMCKDINTEGMEVADFLRNTECVYNQIEKYIKEKLYKFDYKTLQKINSSDITKHQITIKDLKSRNFIPKFFKGKDFPLNELLEAGYLPFKLIEEGGFTFRDMKEAGVTLKVLKDHSGYGRVSDKNTPEVLQKIKDSGYTINDFYYANIPLESIVKAGFTLQEIIGSNKFSITDILKVGFSREQIAQFSDKEYTTEQVLNEIKDEHGNFNFASRFKLKSINEKRKKKIDLILIKQHVPIDTLFGSGYSLQELVEGGCKSSDLIKFIKETSWYTLEILKSFFTLEKLLSDKTEIIDILNIGYNICDLKKNGITIDSLSKLIRDNTYLLKDISACYTLKELLEAGYADLELKLLELGNYSKEEISMNYTLDNLIFKYRYEAITMDILKYFNINDIFKHERLLTTFKYFESFRNMIKQKIIDKEPINQDILDNYLTVEELFTTYNLSFEELLQLGFDIKKTPKSIVYFIKNGKNLDFFKQNNFTVEKLKEIGRYTAKEFKDAGYSVSELKNDFYSVELKDAGYTVLAMKEGGFMDIELYLSGYELKSISQFFVLSLSVVAILNLKSSLPTEEFITDSDRIKYIKGILAIEINLPLKLYFLKIEKTPLDLIYEAMEETRQFGDLIQTLKFIFTPEDFVKSKISMSIYGHLLPTRDLVAADINLTDFVEQVRGENYPYYGDPIGDLLRSANTFVPIRVKNLILSEHKLNDLLKKNTIEEIKETLKYYFNVVYMTPLHPWYKRFKKIDDEVYKRDNGL
jgi:hypothetical protein